MSDKRNTLSDGEIIAAITKGLDLTKANDIKKAYTALQTGQYNFATKEGRDFDDTIYDLYQKVKSGEIKDEVTVKKGIIPKSASSSVRLPKATSKPATTNVRQQTSTATSKPATVNAKSQKANSAKVNGKKISSEKTFEDKYGDSINLLVEKELRKRNKIRKVLIAILVVIAITSLGYFSVYYYMSSRTSSDYEELASLKGSDALSGNVSNEHVVVIHKDDVRLPDILDEYKTLYAKNNRLAGWLKIDGTKIDYPVMQTTDNEYYLSHNYNQEKDNNGSLFLDCECQLYPQSTNMIIYGHHMKSGNMFGNLQKYAKESYWKEHPTITFDTIFETGTYEVMYAFYSKVYDNDDLVFKYYQFIDANSKTEFEYYMSEMKELSLYDTGVEAEFGDRLLTLSTCDHSQTDGRFAVVAKKVR